MPGGAWARLPGYARAWRHARRGAVCPHHGAGCASPTHAASVGIRVVARIRLAQAAVVSSCADRHAELFTVGQRVIAQGALGAEGAIGAACAAFAAEGATTTQVLLAHTAQPGRAIAGGGAWLP
jgi:hypothetical protein